MVLLNSNSCGMVNLTCWTLRMIPSVCQHYKWRNANPDMETISSVEYELDPKAEDATLSHC